jgi:hypothetical protein
LDIKFLRLLSRPDAVNETLFFDEKADSVRLTFSTIDVPNLIALSLETHHPERVLFCQVKEKQTIRPL